jgi:prephenate dehydrogenase
MISTPVPDPVAFGRPSIQRVAILGTGLIGTSIAMAAARAGCSVAGWDLDAGVAERASARSGLDPRPTLEAAVEGADIVVVATPIHAVAETVVRALGSAPAAIVTDAASVKTQVVADVWSLSGDDPALRERYVPGHPMGGSERSGPEHASASVVDGIVWVLAPDDDHASEAVSALDAWVERLGARPVRLTPGRHDRLVAIVSHLPQVASTSLMALAATEEAEEPDILLLAAGGFRDLTRLASSHPALWSDILLANGEPVAEAIDLFIARLVDLRTQITGRDGTGVERVFESAKLARLQLSAKPTVRSGVAVWQVEIPDEPGALARITAMLGSGRVNIEDLQIVHSPEGGRGTVHLTVAAETAADASRVLTEAGYDPIRLA